MLSKLEISSHHRTILFASTLVPGLATTTAITLLAVPEGDRESFASSIEYLSDLIGKPSAASVLMTAVLLLIAAFPVGLAVRSLTFETIRKVAPRRSRSLTDLKETLVRSYGSAVDDALARHVLITRLLDRSEAIDRDGEGRAVSSLTQRELAEEAFRYTKAWLRIRAPQLSVDDLELEINLTWTLLIPVALMGVVGARWMPDAPSPHVLLGCAVIWGGVLGALFRLGYRTRRSEHLAALRQLLFATWISDPAPSEQRPPLA